MKTTLSILAIILMISGQALSSITFLTDASTATNCPAFSCNTTAGPNCAFATGTMAAGRTVTITPCNTGTPFCSYNSKNFYLDTDYTANCQANSLALPGETCRVDGDCAVIKKYDTTQQKFVDFNKCDPTLLTCQGGAIAEQCVNDNTCLAGSYCDTSSGVADQYKCKKQLLETVTCKTTFECVNSLICVSGKCTKPFSQADGFDLSAQEPNVLSYVCQSGYYYNNKCASIKYGDTSTGLDNGVLKCTYGTQCKYTVTFDAATPAVTLPQDCACGYNGDKQGYCPYSRQDDSTKTHFNNLIALKTQNLSNTLHTSSRFAGQVQGTQGSPACYRYYEDVAFFRSLSCVSPVLGQGNCNYIDPKKCPKFSYSATAGATCATSKDIMIYSRSITVNPCNTTTPVCAADTTSFNLDTNVSAPCNVVTPPTAYALPGETCNADTDCVIVNRWNTTTSKFEIVQKCTANKCEGSAATARCDNTNGCLVGNFCNTTNADASKWVCQAQVAEGGDCASTYDCQNSLICASAKCTKAFSQDVGFDLTTVKDPVGVNSACKSGYYSAKSNKCATIDYQNGTTVSDKGLVTCNYGDTCNYTLTIDAKSPPTTETLTQSCQCGYNANGQGYCPYAFHNAKLTQHFQNLVNVKGANLANTNHSLHRSTGSVTNSKASPACYPYYINVAFAGAQQEIINVLGSGQCGDIDKSSSSDTSATTSSTPASFIKLSLLSLIMLVFVLN